MFRLLGLMIKNNPLVASCFLWHHQRESLRFAVRIERTKNCVLHVHWRMRLAITPGRKMLPKVAFCIPPVRFLWVYAQKKQPACCELFLWHHQRESLRFAVRIERTKNYVLHVHWHMRLAITPGRKMLPKVAFYIPPVRFLWVYAQKNNPLVASCFYGTTKGNRTLVFGVRGQRPDR